MKITKLSEVVTKLSALKICPEPEQSSIYAKVLTFWDFLVYVRNWFHFLNAILEMGLKLWILQKTAISLSLFLKRVLRLYLLAWF